MLSKVSQQQLSTLSCVDFVWPGSTLYSEISKEVKQMSEIKFQLLHILI